MQNISNEEFFEGIKRDLKEEEKNNYNNFEDFSALESDFVEAFQECVNKANENLLENSNNVYVKCKIEQEEAINRLL